MRRVLVSPQSLGCERDSQPEKGAMEVKGMRVAQLGEFPLIERIAERLPPYGEDVHVGVGDDVAVLELDDEMHQLATCDIQLEGVHFQRASISPYQLGRKAAAINLSDIGAKGGTPQHFLISLALPPDVEVGWVEGLYDGLAEEAARYGADVVGGNISRSEGPIVIDLFLLGRVRRDELLLRSEACPGDVVLVTGWLGDAAAGLRLLRDSDVRVPEREADQLLAAQLTPTPRVREGRAIARLRRATAMIDLSDGLSSDMGHICAASGVGVRLYANEMPVSRAARRVAGLTGQSDWALALRGGEDYELCLTAPACAEQELVKAVEDASGASVTCIGVVLAEEDGRWVRLADGREVALRPEGWDHFGSLVPGRTEG